VRALLLISLVLLLLVTVFALQNTEPITVRFIMWNRRTSVAAAMIASAMAGALIVYLASVASQRELKSRVHRAETRASELTQAVVETQRRQLETEAPTKAWQPPPSPPRAG
jgi:putative membrane protein